MSHTQVTNAIVEVLSRRITEDVDLGEAAQAIIDALRLREEWTWRNLSGENGTVVRTREDVVQDVAGMSPTPSIIHRLVTDWDVDE